MDMTTKKAFGPSLLHVGLALAVTILAALVSVYAVHDGAPGAFWGAAVASVWFIRGEIDQINPHLGWKTWRLDATPEERQRMVRQAGWPALAAHLVAFGILASRWVAL